MADLEGRVALVTGGGRGLGEAICRVLARSGAVVVVADVRDDLSDGVVRAIRQAGGHATAMKLDVTEEAAAERNRPDRLGAWPVDILVNNAGVDLTVPVDELSIADWDRILAVNLRRPFVMSKLALGHAPETEGTSSTSFRRPPSAWANASAYHASKWGLLGLSHALHVEARPHNVKVTAVVAGGMRTPFLLDRFPDLDPAVLQDPANVAETVRFVLTQPEETVIPEVLVLPMRETSWP